MGLHLSCNSGASAGTPWDEVLPGLQQNCKANREQSGQQRTPWNRSGRRATHVTTGFLILGPWVRIPPGTPALPVESRIAHFGANWPGQTALGSGGRRFRPRIFRTQIGNRRKCLRPPLRVSCPTPDANTPVLGLPFGAPGFSEPWTVRAPEAHPGWAGWQTRQTSRHRTDPGRVVRPCGDRDFVNRRRWGSTEGLSLPSLGSETGTAFKAPPPSLRIARAPRRRQTVCLGRERPAR